jgi:single-stranded DNA-specific DHH superfamily exonuclease
MHKDCKVAVIADWDADGVVSAALALFAQHSKGVFPLKERTKPCLIPSGPRSIKRIEEQNLCWPVVMILDVPFTSEVEEVIKYLRDCGAKIYYFDHHSSTIEAARMLDEEYGVFVVVGRSPTSVILQHFLEGLGVKVTPRLREFVKAVAALEGGKRKPAKEEVPEGIITLAASISKALNQLRDEETWRRYVKWVANPLPFEDAKLPSKLRNIADETTSLVKAGMDLSRESDKRIKETAMSLAMASRNLGFVKFIDARGKWEGRGASALASSIYKIVNMPIALLIEKEDGSRLLIIRSGRGEAEKIMRKLNEDGIVEDMGGHRNIAVARLSDSVTERALEKHLRRASFEAFQQTAREEREDTAGGGIGKEWST